MGWPDSAIVCHAISNGLHSQGCTPGPSRPLLNSQASKALTTTQPARPLQRPASKVSSKPPRPVRPLPNTQTSKASSKLPDQQGLPKTPRPARPQQLLSQQGSRKPPGLTSTGARLTSSYSRPTGRRHGPPGGQREIERLQVRAVARASIPVPWCPPATPPGRGHATSRTLLLLHCYLCPYLGHGHGPLWPGQGLLPPRLRLDQKENNPIKSKA